MNLGDPELEVIDPTPNIHSLFLHFDKLFFWTNLASRAVVRWSKRMYSCAGVCTYEGRGGLCDIALSEPLLKLRPRKNLVETLIHEMIHAYLFVTGNDRDRDGHGPNFQSHMNRINKAAGLNISIYHDFHDEVRLYQTHWWRCDGPCQHRKPYFGMVRRSANRAPGPNDFWWEDHRSKCGGNFIKIKEPDKKGKKSTSTVLTKPMGDITKFINNGNKIGATGNEGTKKNSSSTVVISKPGVIFKPKPAQEVINVNNILNTKGHILNEKSVTKNDNVAETVRNTWLNRQDLTVNTLGDINEKVRQIWANKKIESKPIEIKKKPVKRATTIDLPSPKILKIDDFFKTKAPDLLKNVYGADFTLQQNNETNKVVAITDTVPKKVQCPICNAEIESAKINNHIDECLNKEEIEKICNDQPSCSKDTKPIVKTEVKPESIIDLVVKIERKSPKLEPHVENLVNKNIKVEPGSSLVPKEEPKPSCPCCGDILNKQIEEHLDECLSFFNNNTTVPEEGSSFSDVPTIVIDDDDDDYDDIMDETQTMNATGTKTPCPVCLVMIEIEFMNRHLDLCLLK